jgi:hypothetical protein
VRERGRSVEEHVLLENRYVSAIVRTKATEKKTTRSIRGRKSTVKSHLLTTLEQGSRRLPGHHRRHPPTGWHNSQSACAVPANRMNQSSRKKSGRCCRHVSQAHAFESCVSLARDQSLWELFLWVEWSEEWCLSCNARSLDSRAASHSVSAWVAVQWSMRRFVFCREQSDAYRPSSRRQTSVTRCRRRCQVARPHRPSSRCEVLPAFACPVPSSSVCRSSTGVADRCPSRSVVRGCQRERERENEVS